MDCLHQELPTLHQSNLPEFALLSVTVTNYEKPEKDLFFIF